MNQQYLYYTEYYKSRDYKKINTMLTGGGKYTSSGEKIELTGQQYFALKTIYPGLLMGLGYDHEGGDIGGANKDEEIKLGFSFDYVTGLPYLPGSSVKGVLKSCFQKYGADIAAMLSCSDIEISAFSRAIFGDGDDERHPGTDIFLDAFPVRADGKGRVLGIDYITSHRSKHGKQYDGLSNPNPVRMLKVLPDVEFLFRFVLKDSVVNQIRLPADVKKEVFRELLSRYGAGAKTNTGYGRFQKGETEENYDWLKITHEEPAVSKMRPANNSVNKSAKKGALSYKLDEFYEGVVQGHNPSGKFAHVNLDAGGKASFFDKNNLAIGTKVILQCKGKKLEKDGKQHDSWRLVNFGKDK